MRAIGRMHHVALDTREPHALAQFWSAMLGWSITFDSPEWVVVAADASHSGLAFQLAPDHVPPVWGDTARPQQIHLDVMVDDLDVADPLVVSLGATSLCVEDHVYADPSGHPFCLIARPGWAPPVGP